MAERKKPGPVPRAKFDKTVDAAPLLKSQAELELEEEFGREITVRQRKFCEEYVEGRMTASECARQAGYNVASAGDIASKLLNGRDFPHIPRYIAQLREEKERLYGVTLSGQLERLYKLSRAAEDGGQFSAAINAEKIRSALGGLTVDRRENINTIDQMTRDQITARLAELQQKYPQAFVIDAEYTEVPSGRTRSKGVGKYAEISAPEVSRDED
jgi:phage terminase small subunit